MTTGATTAALQTGRPRILILNQAYLPGFRFGGPIRTLANFCEQMGDSHDIAIVTTDRDLGSDEPYPGVTCGQWTIVGKAKVLYLSPGQIRQFAILRAIRETPHDWLFLNSFLDPWFSALPVIARKLGVLPDRPVVLAPRGEFAPAALALKAGKKRLFVRLSRALGLHAGVRWLATSPEEAAQIGAAMGKAATDIQIAPNLADLSALASGTRAIRAPGTPLKLVFLARISPMKNLALALEALQAVSVPVDFDIRGIREDEDYWARCEALIAGLPPTVQVRLLGPTQPGDVAETLAGYDVLIQPSLGENFGHIIAESLLAGTRVLISDRTPWRGLEAVGAGWDVPLEAGPQAFASIIDGAARQRDALGEDWHAAPGRYARERLAAPAALSANVAVFR